MIINFLKFSICVVLSGVAVFPNIFHPKYVKNDENMFQIGLTINTILFTSSIYGLFTGSYGMFLYGCVAESIYLYSFKPFMRDRINRINR